MSGRGARGLVQEAYMQEFQRGVDCGQLCYYGRINIWTMDIADVWLIQLPGIMPQLPRVLAGSLVFFGSLCWLPLAPFWCLWLTVCFDGFSEQRRVRLVHGWVTVTEVRRTERRILVQSWNRYRMTPGSSHRNIVNQLIYFIYLRPCPV